MPVIAGEELVPCICGRCNCGGNLNPAGKPLGPGGLCTAGPGVDAPGVIAPLFGAFCLDTEKAFILARMSGFICAVPPLAPASEPAVGGGFPLAAFSVPKGVDEAVMLEVSAPGLDSLEVVRAGGRIWPVVVGEPKGGEAGSESEGESGDGGGDSRGDWAGDSSAMVGVGGGRSAKRIARFLRTRQTFAKLAGVARRRLEAWSWKQ